MFKPSNSLDIDIMGPRHLMLWGSPRTYKSRFAATAPKPFFIMFDGPRGAKSIKEFGADYQIYPTTADGWQAFDDDSRAMLKAFRDEIYDTLVLDSATAASVACMDWVMRDTKRTKKLGDQYTWGIRAQLMQKLIYMLGQDYPTINTIVICHDKYHYNDEGTVTKITPYLPGQAATEGPAMFEDIIETSIAQIGSGGTITPRFDPTPHRIKVRGSSVQLKAFTIPTWQEYMRVLKEAVAEQETNANLKRKELNVNGNLEVGGPLKETLGG